MKINRKKLELARARACIGTKEIVESGFPKGTYCGILRGNNVKPETAGKLAKILGCDITDIIDQGVEEIYTPPQQKGDGTNDIQSI